MWPVITLSMSVAAVASAPPSAVHPARAAQIKATIAAGATWEVGAVPRFERAAPGAFRPLLGVKGDWVAAIERAVEKGLVTRLLHNPDVAIPESFDSAARWPQCARTINDIRDQSNCGECSCFTSTLFVVSHPRFGLPVSPLTLEQTHIRMLLGLCRR